jgi:hypothetical protein
MRDGPDYVIPPSGSAVATLAEAAALLHNAGDYVFCSENGRLRNLTKVEELELRAAFDSIPPGRPLAEPLTE